MPALLKLTRSFENLRDSLRTQPPTFDRKKNYVYKRLVGKGTFGKVLHAIWHDPGTLNERRALEKRYPRKPAKRDVALKVVKKSNLKKEDKNIVMFEVDILRRLDHKNVIRFYETFESHRNYYISFEYAAGGELFDRIKQTGGKFTEMDAKKCVRSILNGVEYLHKNGIVHHDLKPENILLRSKAPEADIVLADFGAARHVHSPDELLFCDTGTYDYSPPEIFTREGHGTKLDIWAVGVITHALLSGMMPFPNQTLEILKHAILRCKLAFEGRYWERVSQSAKAFVSYLIHADQVTRPSASEALAHEWLTEGSESGSEFSSRATSVDILGNTDREETRGRTRTREKAPVFATKSIPDLPGLRENYNEVARARWRIAIGSAIAVNRLRDAGRAASRRRTGEYERPRTRSTLSPYGAEYDPEFDGEMNMSNVSLASAISLATYASRMGSRTSFEVSLEEEANSPEKLRELEKLVASRPQVLLARNVPASSSDSLSPSESSSPRSTPPPTPPPKRSQHQPRPNLRPPSRGWSGSTSSTSTTDSGSSGPSGFDSGASPVSTHVSHVSYASQSTTATSIMSITGLDVSCSSGSIPGSQPEPNSRSMRCERKRNDPAALNFKNGEQMLGWHTSLISPELESSLNSFKTRW